MDDNRKNLLTAAGLLIVLAAVAAFPQSGSSKMDANLSTMPENTTVRAVFMEENKKVASLDLEVADSQEERVRGLMFRESLEEGKGMLFVWNNSEKRGFWMKNTYIPLDIIFVTAEKTVQAIKEADPQPNVSEENLKVYASEGPARYVIETNQNFSDMRGIEEGTKVDFRVLSR